MSKYSPQYFVQHFPAFPQHPGTAPVRMSAETLARLVQRFAHWSLTWPDRTFGTKIEPIADEE